MLLVASAPAPPPKQDEGHEQAQAQAQEGAGEKGGDEQPGRMALEAFALEEGGVVPLDKAAVQPAATVRTHCRTQQRARAPSDPAAGAAARGDRGAARRSRAGRVPGVCGRQGRPREPVHAEAAAPYRGGLEDAPGEVVSCRARRGGRVAAASGRAAGRAGRGVRGTRGCAGEGGRGRALGPASFGNHSLLARWARQRAELDPPPPPIALISNVHTLPPPPPPASLTPY